MPSINLAPGTQYIIEAKKRRQRLYNIAISLVAIVGVLWASLYFYYLNIVRQVDAAEASIRNIDAEIAKSQLDYDQITSFEQRLQGLDTLLNNHISWNSVFQELERLLPADTVLTSLASNTTTNTLSVRGITPNIDAVAVTLASIKNQPGRQTIFTSASFVNSQRQEVAVDGTADRTVTYTFAAEFAFDPAVLFVNQ